MKWINLLGMLLFVWMGSVSFAHAKQNYQMALIAKGKGEPFTLGKTTLSASNTDKDSNIWILFCQEAKEIKLKLAKEAFISKIHLSYSDGSDKTFQLYRLFPENSDSVWIKLGKDKCIDTAKVTGYGVNGAAALMLIARN